MKYQYYYEREKRRLGYKKTPVFINYALFEKAGVLIYVTTGSIAFILAATSIIHDSLMLVANAV